MVEEEQKVIPLEKPLYHANYDLGPLFKKKAFKIKCSKNSLNIY